MLDLTPVGVLAAGGNLLNYPGAVRGLVQDLHNDVIGVISPGNQLLERYDYDLYGNREYLEKTSPAACASTLDVPCASQHGNSRGYTGRPLSPVTGMYDLRFRHYDPNLRIFLSPDPLGYAASGFDLWLYVGGDPLNYIDPFGLKSQKEPTRPRSSPHFGSGGEKSSGRKKRLQRALDEIERQVDALPASKRGRLKSDLDDARDGLTTGNLNEAEEQIGQAMDKLSKIRRFGGDDSPADPQKVADILNSSSKKPTPPPEPVPEDALQTTPKTRDHGGRFDGPRDAMEQYEEIDEAQREVKSNKGKLKGKKIIDSTEKSKQRDRNALKELEGLSPDEIKEALEE